MNIIKNILDVINTTFDNAVENINELKDTVTVINQS